uniref:Nestin n=1 Tax=Cyprinodon variegatus TaxID=28743 RepID=A0A3Q2DCI1_CYPVA
MELHGVHKIFHANHFGEEKQQMLNLNRRLETYLSRVKLLEEENEMLANEINVLRHNNQGTLTRRKGLEEELRQARLEVDAAWRDRVLTEVEVQKLSEEIQALELQRQREAEAKMLAKTKMEQSRKEMEDEQRAQIWLREKVNQLEHEMRFLIQTHEEDVAHLEATMTQSRAKMIPNLIQRSKQTPDLLQVGHEFSQRATRAWQEAAEAYQSQLAQLEESLGQARSRLGQVCQEKRESQLKLQTLEKEIASAKDVRLHLEKTVAQRREEHCHQIQQLQVKELEVEKLEVSQQIDDLLQENQNLMRLKMSLGLEVATYSPDNPMQVCIAPMDVLNDISAKEPELENKNFNQSGNMASVLQQVDGDQEHVPPPDKEDEEDEEDTQNVSVSWKTERESDSYAQENTLADTRPLIRYKSDDTDANTQASHFDESESSDGEQEKKAGEAGPGTWGDGKPKTFGTMEDLCEEVEEETVDDDYNLGYTHVEERDVEQSETVCEDRELVNETENVAVVSGIEEHSEEETEELTGATVQMNTDYDEELDTDRLVEQELEKLSTDSYSAHFAHEKSEEDILEMEQISVKETDKQEASVYTAHFESEIKTNWESSDINEVSDRQPFTDPSMETHSTNNLTEEAVKEQEETGNPAVNSTSEPEMQVNSEFGPFTTITGEATERHLFSDLFAEMHSTNDLTEKVLIEQTETDKATEETYTSEPEMKVNSEFGPFTTITGEATERHLFSHLLAEIHSTNDLTEKVLIEQKETDKATEETYTSEPEISGEHDHVTSLIVEDEALETQHFPEPYVKMYSANTLTEDGTQHNDPEAVDKPETREEDEEDNKMSHIEATEHQSSLEDVFSRSGVKDVKNIQDRGSVLLETEDLKPLEDFDAPPEVTEALPEEVTSVVAQEHHIEDAENVHRFAIDGKTAEWNNAGKESEKSDQEKQEPKSADAQELSDDDIIIHQEEHVEVSPDRALNENDIFIVKDATESSFHGHFSSDGKNDFWVSSLETGATYPPGEAYKEAAEVTTDSQGFSENIDGGNFENPKVVNGNSKMHTDPSGLDPMKEQEMMSSEVKKAFCRNEGEIVHSEESDVEAESWSSGEETV